MSLPKTSKQKSARTWWGYHTRQTRRERRLHTGWLVAATIGCGIWSCWWLPSPAGSSVVLESWAAPGKLASVHKAWNQECDACHQPFYPVNSHQGTATDLGNFITSTWPGVFDSRTADEKCQHCHAAETHHSNQQVTELGKCADCHQDHQGEMTSLVQLEDRHCLRCHSDLKNHVADVRKLDERAAEIRDFATKHPEFAAVARPAEHHRGLKFSHAVHMLPGMGLKRVDPKTGAATDGGPFTYNDIAGGDRSRFLNSHGEPPEGSAVQLVCADCHQLDASPNTTSEAATLANLAPVRGDGRYYLPIVYERHCQACHPLSFDPTDPAAKVVHGKQPAEVEQQVLDHFSRKFLTQALQARTRKPANLRLDSLPDLLTESERRELDEQARAANADLWSLLAAVNPPARELLDQSAVVLFRGRKTCGECHTAEFADSQSPVPTKIEAVNIPTIWEQKAVFDHVSHQALECKTCHPHSSSTDLAAERERARQNNPQGVGLNVYQHPPDLPSIESCRVCHSDKQPWSRSGKGGVSHRCTDCHTYHNAEHGLQGRGARTLGVEYQLSNPLELLQPPRPRQTSTKSVPVTTEK